MVECRETHIMYALSKYIRIWVPSLDLKRRGDIVRNAKRGHLCPNKQTCILLKKTVNRVIFFYRQLTNVGNFVIFTAMLWQSIVILDSAKVSGCVYGALCLSV